MTLQDSHGRLGFARAPGAPHGNDATVFPSCPERAFTAGPGAAGLTSDAHHPGEG